MYRKTPNQKENSARWFQNRKRRDNLRCACGELITYRSKTGKCVSCLQQERRPPRARTLGRGKIYANNGYTKVYIGGKYILEHRYVWETYYSKKLPQGWQVHHLDGNKTNNDVKNLHACSKHDHLSSNFTKILQRRIRGLQRELAILRNSPAYPLL